MNTVIRSKHKKVLFVSSNMRISHTGAAVCSVRNWHICVSVFGESNSEKFILSFFSLANTSFFERVSKLFYAGINLLQGFCNGSSHSTDKKIIDVVRKKELDYVFIDSSLNGMLVKKLKKETKALVIVFFHNCEKYMVLGQIRKGNLLAVFRYLSVVKNERKSCLFADKIIALNRRDSRLLEAVYHRKPDLLLPISLTDCVDEKRIGTITNRPTRWKKTGLFVGSYFWGNIEGLNLFIKNVLPFVEMELIIVGRGMSRLKTDNSKVRIFDGVETLEPFYLNADFVVAPIVSGGGMKVKVAEAMMYGKMIIGTPEAFEGYENIPGSYVCSNWKEFIRIIENLPVHTYNPDTRKCFKDRYETQGLIKSFANLISL